MSFLRRNKRANKRNIDALPKEAVEILKRIDELTKYDKDALRAASEFYRKENGL